MMIGHTTLITQSIQLYAHDPARPQCSRPASKRSSPKRLAGNPVAVTVEEVAVAADYAKWTSDEQRPVATLARAVHIAPRHWHTGPGVVRIAATVGARNAQRSCVWHVGGPEVRSSVGYEKQATAQYRGQRERSPIAPSHPHTQPPGCLGIILAYGRAVKGAFESMVCES